MGDFKEIIAEVTKLSEAQGEESTLQLLKSLNENKDYNDTQTLLIMLVHKSLSYSLHQLKTDKRNQNTTYKYAITILTYLLKKYDKKFKMKSLSKLLDRSLSSLYDYIEHIENLNEKFPDDKLHLDYLTKIETQYLNYIKQQ